MLIVTADYESCQAMTPQIMPGDWLRIDIGAPINEKDLVLLRIDNKEMLGRVKLISCGVWVSFSNPAYDAIYVPTEELDKIHILGKVVERIRRYK